MGKGWNHKLMILFSESLVQGRCAIQRPTSPKPGLLMGRQTQSVEPIKINLKNPTPCFVHPHQAAMEDSFNSRVGKIFGSLASSSSSSSPATITTLSPSLWSLTDDEIERKEWIRDKTIPESESETESGSFFGNPRWEAPEEEKNQVELTEELEKDLEDLVDDDVDEPPRRQLDKPDDYNDEEWNMKSCIGQDCTLDYEVRFFFSVAFSLCSIF